MKMYLIALSAALLIAIALFLGVRATNQDVRFMEIIGSASPQPQSCARLVG